MKVYVAAPWVNKEGAKVASDLCEAAGHTITKKWWEHPEVAGYLLDTCSDEDTHELIVQAFEDVRGVADADVFLLLNTSTSEGKSVELGLAWAYSTARIILVGRRSNLFHYLPEITIVPTVEEALSLF